MSRDVSKDVVVVLLILTVIVSILGTWQVTIAASKIQIPEVSEQDNSATGFVINNYNPETPRPAVGQVGINIIGEEDARNI